MNLPLAIASLLAISLSVIAQQPLAPVDPPQLVSRRAAHILAMKRAEIAPLTSYIKTLTSLRQQFIREANLEAVGVVDAEIKVTTEELTAAIKATDITTGAQVQLRIDQAHFGDFQTNRTVDVTSYIQNGFASGAPTIGIRGSVMLGAHDPAPGVTKSLKVVYTFNGKRKEKTFNTGEKPELDFKRDLK